MPKANKPKSSLANVIKERAQRPDFLPKSFIEDNNRLADETLSGAHALALPGVPAHTRHSLEPASSAASPTGSVRATVPPGGRAPAHPRPYAKAVLDQRAPNTPDPDPARQLETDTPSSSSVSPYRRNLKRVATYLADPAKDQLRVLCFNERTSEEDLLREAIDMLFKHRGLPQIAFQGAPSRKTRQP